MTFVSTYAQERRTLLAPLVAAHAEGGPAAVLAAAKGARSTYESHAWSLAMTAVYGPLGVHPAQTEHPDVVAAKARAADRLRTFLAA
jgi:hypothetical protein